MRTGKRRGRRIEGNDGKGIEYLFEYRISNKEQGSPKFDE